MKNKDWTWDIGGLGKRGSYFLKGIFFFLSLSLIPALLQAQPMPFKNLNFPKLIETAELVPFVTHPSVRIIDMRSSLLDYLKGHLPNAVYLHFEALRVPQKGIPAQGPDRLYLEKLIGGHLSVSNAMWVIIYSEKSNPNAAFLAWVFDHLGHKKVGVVNGGWEKWAAEKLPVTQTYPDLKPKKFFAKVNRESLVDKKQVQARLSTKRTVIVDARPPKQFSGEEGEEIRRGHIPGAKNFFWENSLEGDEVRVWKKKEDLEKLFKESDVTKDKEVIVHCRTGREASHLYITLKYGLGYPNVRLYRGSWVEWSADLNLPVKIGTDS